MNSIKLFLNTIIKCNGDLVTIASGIRCNICILNEICRIKGTTFTCYDLIDTLIYCRTGTHLDSEFNQLDISLVKVKDYLSLLRSSYIKKRFRNGENLKSVTL